MGNLLKKIVYGILNYFSSGANNKISRYLNFLAGRRVIECMVRRTDNFQSTYWLGRPIWQFPLGAWVLQEVISDLKPDLIVETGTHRGGSAYFFATLCELLNQGRVISIDISAKETQAHPRVEYWAGSSVELAVIDRLKKRILEMNAKKILVVLDSDHSSDHVSKELELYAPLVPAGSYIHVQDGCMDEYSFLKGPGPGPKVAAINFLKKNKDFLRDIKIESRYEITFHPYGWLKKTGQSVCGEK